MRVVFAVLTVLAAALVIWLLRNDPGPDTVQPSTSPLEADSGPTLGTTKKPVEPSGAAAEREAARKLADELRDLTDTERAALLQERVGRDPDQKLPYSEELARLFLRMAIAPEGVMGNYGASYLRMLGPRAAPLINEVLNADPDSPHAALLLGIVTFWVASGQQDVALPELLPLLSDDRPYLQKLALTITRFGVPHEPRVANRLLEMFLARPDIRVGGPGMGLARMGPEGVAMLLAHAQSETDRLGRLEALQVLSKAQPEDIRPHLATLSALIADPDLPAAYRSAAIYGLIGMRGDCVECLPALRTALQDRSFEYIGPMVGVLEAMGPRAAPAVPDLLRFLEIDDPRVADSTAKVLAKIGARPDLVLPALDMMVRTFASDEGARALGSFGVQALPIARRILEEGDEYAQYAVLWGFAALGEQAAPAVPELLALLDGDDEDIALRAIGTLGYIGPKAAAAVPHIMTRTFEGDGTLSAKAAAGALVRMGEPAQQALLGALRSSDAAKQKRAAEVLTHFHLFTTFALDDLERLTSAKDPQTRAHAYKAIAVTVIDPRDPWTAKGPALDPAMVKRVRTILQRGEKDQAREVQLIASQQLQMIQMLQAAAPGGS